MNNDIHTSALMDEFKTVDVILISILLIILVFFYPIIVISNAFNKQK